MSFPYIRPPSPIQTFTVGSGITPDRPIRLAGFTAGRDLHPALKIILFIIFVYAIIIALIICNVNGDMPPPEVLL